MLADTEIMLDKLIVLSLVLVACSAPVTVTTTARANSSFGFESQPSTTVGGSSATSGTTIEEVTQTTVPGSDADDLIIANAAILVAALEESFAGTSFEGAVLESPELFVAAGEVICVRLDSGDDVDTILQDYLEGLLSNADGGVDTVSENDAVIVAGGVLGASVELFCPQHREKIAG